MTATTKAAWPGIVTVTAFVSLWCRYAADVHELVFEKLL